MGSTGADKYSLRHVALLDAFKDTGFSSNGDWKAIIPKARQLVVTQGFDDDRYKVCEEIRKAVKDGKKAKASPAETMFEGANLVGATAGINVPNNLASRVAALEIVRHLWLLKKSGSHKLWVLSLPDGYKDWPDRALTGKTYAEVSQLLNDESSHFSTSDRKHLSQATQEGLVWVHKAMMVAASPEKKKNKEILQRWFADAMTTDEELVTAAGVLNAGLKKISGVIKSTFLLFLDMPMERGDAAEANTTAFVYGSDTINVVYIEAAFFATDGLFKGLKDWSRIVVHELSHREAKTDDNRYRHNPAGLKPDASDPNFNAAKALNNADSWAMFCMDCAGQMSKGDYLKVKV